MALEHHFRPPTWTFDMQTERSTCTTDRMYQTNVVEARGRRNLPYIGNFMRDNIGMATGFVGLLSQLEPKST